LDQRIALFNYSGNIITKYYYIYKYFLRFFSVMVSHKFWPLEERRTCVPSFVFA